MADQPIDVGDWFLENNEAVIPAEHDLFRLPANMSNSSLWNNNEFFDLQLAPDHPHPLDNVPNPAPRPDHPAIKHAAVSALTDPHLHTSPVTTRVDAPATTPDAPAHPKHVPVQHLVPIRTAHADKSPAARTSAKPRINKLISKNIKVPSLRLADGRAALLNATPQRQASSVLSHPSRAPKGRRPKQKKHALPHRLTPSPAKIENPLLSPALGAPKPGVKKSPSQKRPADESRERHNQMMRQNRSRFNNKFKELTDLLDSFKEPGCDYKPMKNKIQILERAIYQYAQMESKRARYENELMFSPEHPEEVRNEYLKVFIAVPSLSDACELLIQHMCATMNWKYGEAWIRKPAQGSDSSIRDQYELSTAVISKNNMPDTRQALQQFSERSKLNKMDDYLYTLAQHHHAVWIPDLASKEGKSRRAKEAKKAGITTMFTVPVTLSQDVSGPPDAIITLMHVNDDLLAFPRDERPYDSDSMTRLLDLVAAVVKSRTKPSC